MLLPINVVVKLEFTDDDELKGKTISFLMFPTIMERLWIYERFDKELNLVY